MEASQPADIRSDGLGGGGVEGFLGCLPAAHDCWQWKNPTSGHSLSPRSSFLQTHLSNTLPCQLVLSFRFSELSQTVCEYY